MPRPVDTGRRDALLHAAATHLVEHGLVDAPLGAIARSAGTSDRMLVHYFGTRDRLIAGALEIARERELAAARRHLLPAADAIGALDEAWTWLGAPDTIKYFRLFQQVAALEQVQPILPVTSFRQRIRSDWLPLFTAIFDADPFLRSDATALARTTVTYCLGLSLELVRSDEPDALRRDWRSFLALIKAVRSSAQTLSA